jgi:hypothetical protein
VPLCDNSAEFYAQVGVGTPPQRFFVQVHVHAHPRAYLASPHADANRRLIECRSTQAARWYA